MKKVSILSLLVIMIIIFSTLVPVFGHSGINNEPASEEDPTWDIFLPIVTCAIGKEEVEATIGDIDITVSSPVMPDELIASEASDAIQVASAYSLDNHEEISINSIAYGETSPIEQLPTAEEGAANLYRTELATFRSSQGGTPTPGPTANLFGQDVASSYSVVSLQLTSEGEKPYLIVEWVVDALEHLWIVRISRDISDGTDVQEYLLNLEQLRITGDNQQTQANEIGMFGEKFEPELLDMESRTSLSEPEWWKDDDGVWWQCDRKNYLDNTGVESSPLGYSYEGLTACGPRPYTYAWGSKLNPGPVVQFFPGAWGEHEWQCVELAMRYLYLKYGIVPYSANGKDVVNYFPINQHSEFEVIWDGTPNKAPQPGDVISFSGFTSVGHVAVVTYSDVHENGDGFIQIIEQNSSEDGHNIIIVDDWQLKDYKSAINWLHKSTEPGIVTLLSPDDGIYIDTLLPEFQWDSGENTDADYAILQISDNGTDFEDYIYTSDTTGFYSYRMSSNLNPSHKYYWRVLIYQNEEVIASSDIWSFTTTSDGIILPAPELISPSNNITISNIPVSFQWTEVSGALKYQLCVYNIDDENDRFCITELGSTYWESSNLENYARYQWQVSARNDYAWGESSDMWYFDTSY